MNWRPSKIFEANYVARLLAAASQLLGSAAPGRLCFVLAPPGLAKCLPMTSKLSSLLPVIEFPIFETTAGAHGPPLFLDHRVLRYTDAEMQSLIHEFGVSDPLSAIDVFQLRQLSGAWPGLTEAVLRDAVQATVSDAATQPLRSDIGLSERPQAHAFMAQYWLPVVQKYCPQLFEASLLPLLSNDVLAAVFSDAMPRFHGALQCGWLETRPNKLGQLRVEALLEQMLLSETHVNRDALPIEAALAWYIKQGLTAEAVECAAILGMEADEISEVSRLATSSVAKTHPLAALLERRGLAAVAYNDARPSALSVLIADIHRSSDLNVDMDQVQAPTGDALGVAISYVLSALNHRRSDRPSASAVALSLAARAGIDKQQLNRLMSFSEFKVESRTAMSNESADPRHRQAVSRALSSLQHVEPAITAVFKAKDVLNHRETQVMALICAGLTNKEIATRLTLELSTVKWYATRIYEKLGVRNRTQAVAKAQALQLVE